MSIIETGTEDTTTSKDVVYLLDYMEENESVAISSLILEFSRLIKNKEQKKRLCDALTELASYTETTSVPTEHLIAAKLYVDIIEVTKNEFIDEIVAKLKEELKP